jgi:hypothetical protein
MFGALQPSFARRAASPLAFVADCFRSPMDAAVSGKGSCESARAVRSSPGGSRILLPALLLQMAGEMLVHLEHGHLVLAKDPPELVVGQDFAAVLRVLQLCERIYSHILLTT